MSADVGRNIQKYRVLAGLSQKELAQKAGISRSTIRDLEAPGSPRDGITLYTASRLAGVLSCSIDDLWGDEYDVEE